jgi:hypothetical protein
MAAGDIHSSNVVLLEGIADELVPKAESVAGMRGFVIMVPLGEDYEWFLDLLWRITIVYAGKPSWLRSRTKMSQIVEAVMSKEKRDPKPAQRPARSGGVAVPAGRHHQAARHALIDRLQRQPAINAGRWTREELYEREPKGGKKGRGTRKKER